MTSDARHPPPFWPTVIVLIAATVVYCAPLFTNLDWYGWQDWDQFTFRYETPRIALLRDHQWPVWNPYANGGTMLLAHPHSPVLSPWYAITLLLGAPVGLRVQVLVCMALGAIGMAALLRHAGAGRAAGICAGIVLMMSAHFALHITEGHLEWTALGVMPWVVLGLLQALSAVTLRVGRAALIRSAVLFATVLTLGAVYIPAIYMPFLTVWMAFECVRRRRLTPLAAWGLIVVLAAGLSAVKLVPMSQFVSEHGRVPTSNQRTSLTAIAGGVGGMNPAGRYATYQGTKVPGYDPRSPVFMPLDWYKMDFEFHEYGAYPGLIGGIAALVGVIATARTWWPLYAAGGVMAWMLFGAYATPDLWALLRKLPMYGQMQVPSRMLAGLVFVGAFAAGFGMDVLSRRIAARPRWRVVPWVLCAVLYLELAVMGHTLFSQIFSVPPVTLAASAAFAQRPPPPESAVLVPRPMKSLMFPRLAANWGALDGYENLTIPMGGVKAVGDPGYRGEVFVTGAGGSAEIDAWTMARVRVRVRADAPAVVAMNQNYDPGWRVRQEDANGAAEGPAVRTPDGVISASVPAGESIVEFRFWPRGLTAGIWITVAALLVCAVGLRRW